jgi:hypothetical protein
MVSHAERRRAFRPALITVVALSAWACSRHADIQDEPDGGTNLGPSAPQPDAGIPAVEDTGLDDPSLLACADRPEAENGACRGANDFPCDFSGWVPLLAEQCQTETGCVTNGWVEIELGDDGCASELRMDQPNADYVACLVQTLGAYSCPCEAMSFGHFLGVGNEGCETGPSPCTSGEFPCAGGQICVDGFCVVDASGGAPG